jgi:hypothetical protein
LTAHGYQRVKPPLVEFEETLFAGAGASMATSTFRMMDPVSHRMIGVRADMTPQIARIAATRLGGAPRPLRLSYAGQVLRVRGSEIRPERQIGQVGADHLQRLDGQNPILAAQRFGRTVDQLRFTPLPLTPDARDAPDHRRRARAKQYRTSRGDCASAYAAQPGHRLGDRTSVRQTAHRLDQDRIVGRGLELRLPELGGPLALAFRPQHFAQMRCDLGVGLVAERAPQEFFRIVELAKPVVGPAHAVENERIVRRDLQRFFDQLKSLGGARVRSTSV